MLNIKTQQTLKLLALNQYPQEACAVIRASGEVLPMLNVSETPEKSFSFDEGEFLKLCMQFAGEQLAIWHSHTQKNAFFDPRTPSEADVLLHESSGCTLYISAYDGEATYLDVVQFPKPPTPEIPLIGRPYIAGIFDCGTLACDWYRKNRNVELQYKFLSSYLHKKNWPKAVLNFLEVNGFSRMPKKAGLEAGDILVVDFLDLKSSHGVLVIDDALHILDQRNLSRMSSMEDYPEIRSVWRRL